MKSFQIESAISLTSLNAVYLGNSVNRFFPMNGKVTVNATLEMADSAYTRSSVVKRDIQKKLIAVIQVCVIFAYTMTYVHISLNISKCLRRIHDALSKKSYAWFLVMLGRYLPRDRFTLATLPGDLRPICDVTNWRTHLLW